MTCERQKGKENTSSPSSSPIYRHSFYSNGLKPLALINTVSGVHGIVMLAGYVAAIIIVSYILMKV